MGSSTSIFVLFLFWCFTSGLCFRKYTVYIITGYQETSSRVKIRLVGDGGSTSAHELHPSGGTFISGSRNKFIIIDHDVGKLNAVELYLHSGSSWNVKRVVVVAGGIYSFIYYGNINPGKWTAIGSKCARGYQKSSSGICEDIDECKKNPCKGPIVKCQNTIGSYKCMCPRGYRVRYEESCEDINECHQIKRPLCDQKCENTPGSYRCYCRSGYKFEEGKCLDIDECAKGIHKCDPSTSICSNTNGSYHCNCKPGHYRGKGNTCNKVKCPPLAGSSFAVISPPRCNNDNNYYSDVCTYLCKKGYKLQDPKVNSLKCSADGRWKGTAPGCNAVKCPTLSSLANGRLLPSTCTTVGGSYKGQCTHLCNNGYVRSGSPLRECQADKTWSGSQPTCNKVVVKPTIQCPAYLYVDLAPGQKTADVSSKWKNPTYTGNTVTLTVSPSFASAKYRYPAGSTKITWTATNSDGSASCSIMVRVYDKELPKISYCPSRFVGVLTNTTSAKVTWKKPTFTDNVGVTKVTSNRKSGDVFDLGSWNVYYTASDAAGNRVVCKFEVVVKRITCPLPPSGPFNGTKKCSTFGYTKFCIASCPVGKHIFKNPSPYSHWTCKSGSWSPTPKIPDCVAAALNSNGSACTGLQVNMQVLVLNKTINKYITRAYCADCPTGTYSKNATCMSCPVGQYQDEQGRSSCKPCPVKATSSNSGAADVKDCRFMCAPGQFSPDGLNPGCKVCPKGTYQEQRKSTQCKKCPNGTSTISVASTQLSDCGVKPTISSLTAKPDTINERQDTTISCYASGVPNPMIRLTFTKIIPVAFLGKMKWEFIKDSNGNKKGIKLTITGATFHNTGQYECKAENSFGKVLKEVTLTVKKVFG